MYSETEDLVRDLAANAESVCRAYLPAGRREGSYWIVGDLQNNPGRSLFVRLAGPASGPGAAGKFTDGATGEHGDLLDIIRERTGISRFPDLLAEARAHLGVDSGWGRNRIISSFDHDFGHLYSPVSKICAHPRGEICDRSSCGLSRPARFRAATARPRWSVFQ